MRRRARSLRLRLRRWCRPASCSHVRQLTLRATGSVLLPLLFPSSARPTGRLRRLRKGKLVNTILVGGLLFCVAAAHAEDTITFGSIGGVVSDPAGRVVTGAHVSARRAETNQRIAGVTDTEGRFRLPYLKAGGYEITVNYPGFAEAVRAVTVTVGSAFELAI